MEEKDRRPEPIEARKQEPKAAEHGHDEEHAHGNYRFAFKILLILAAIILIIVILKATGVPIAVKDWLSAASTCLPLHF